MIRSLASILIALAWADPLAAQGSAADYERASQLRARFANKVVGGQLTPVWLEGGRLVFTRRGESGQDELVLVNPHAPEGRRQTVLSEMPEVAKVLAERGTSLVTAASGADGRVQLLFEDGSAAAFDPDSGSWNELALAEADGLLLETQTRARGGSGRGRTTVLFVNQTTEPVELFWVASGGEGRSYGKVAPGEVRSMSTFVGHVWRIEQPEALRKGGASERAPRAFFVGTRQVGVALLDDQTWTARIGNARSGRESRGSTARGDRDQSRPRLSYRSDGDLYGPSWNGRDADVPWTEDGTPEDSYQGRPNWSPDGRAFAVNKRRRAADQRRVAIVESSPEDQLQPKLVEFNYTKPGDEIDFVRPRVFRLTEAGEPVAVPIDDAIFGTPWRVSQQSWSSDGKRFRFLVNYRGHQRLAYYELDVESGELRTLIDERSATFVDYSQKTYLDVMEERGYALWASERSGWNHLYRIDLKTAEATPLTQGEWVLRSVEEVTEDGRALLRIMGYHEGQDPYHMHYAWLDLESGELTVITEGDGTHQLTWSADREFFVDRWSRVDQPPVHELRRADGTLVCELARADASALVDAGWREPQRFMAKGRDGETEIWGVVYRPSNFDPAKKYPIIENIYAGPHGFHVEKTWSVHRKSMEMAELGFIVVRIDGMGTNWRSKAFHDHAWKNIADAGFEDRKLWIRAFAQTEAAADLSRVGIYGGSAGGQNAMRALIDHHDLYDAAVADCGCHDNRMDKIWWNEAWMGWPVDESYAQSSNVDHAHRMQGDLLLIVGELDRNVDPASTTQVVDALIRADKDFEFLLVPGGGHGIAESRYGTRRRRDFFVRHLHGVEPRWEAAASVEAK